MRSHRQDALASLIHKEGAELNAIRRKSVERTAFDIALDAYAAKFGQAEAATLCSKQAGRLYAEAGVSNTALAAGHALFEGAEA